MLKKRIQYFIIPLAIIFLSNAGFPQDSPKVNIKRDTVKIETRQKTTTVDSVITKTTQTDDNTWIWAAVIGVVLLVLVLGYFIGRSRNGTTTSGGQSTGQPSG